MKIALIPDDVAMTGLCSLESRETVLEHRDGGVGEARIDEAAARRA